MSEVNVAVNETVYATDVEAVVNYAGDIQGRGRFDLVDPVRTNLVLNPVQVRIRDVRPRGTMPLLADAGFEFVKHQSQVVGDPAFFEGNLVHQIETTQLNAIYEAEMAEMLKAKLGARDVFSQQSGLIARTSDRAARKSWAGAGAFVHLDFTADSAEKFLRWSLEAKGVSPKPFSRMMMMQTWRALSPGPQDNSLAICNGSTVPPEDAVLFDSRIGDENEPGKFFESRLCKFRPSHEWYYLSDMEQDDLLLFKGYDSECPVAMNAMHTAFDNPLGADGPPRKSIEARFFLLFD